MRMSVADYWAAVKSGDVDPISNRRGKRSQAENQVSKGVEQMLALDRRVFRHARCNAGKWLVKYTTTNNVEREYMVRGLPEGYLDRFAELIGGRIVWFEVKVAGKSPRKKQAEFIVETRRHGGVADIVYNADDVLTVLNGGTIWSPK